MFTKIKTFLAGKKSYITAVAAALTAIAGWGAGTIGDVEFIQAIYAAVALATMRAAVAK